MNFGINPACALDSNLFPAAEVYAARYCTHLFRSAELVEGGAKMSMSRALVDRVLASMERDGIGQGDKYAEVSPEEAAYIRRFNANHAAAFAADAFVVELPEVAPLSPAEVLAEQERFAASLRDALAKSPDDIELRRLLRDADERVAATRAGRPNEAMEIVFREGGAVEIDYV